MAAFVLVFVGYGLQRCTLGIDLTDEGAYLAWPMRMLFGEKPFTSELLTLLRPIEVYLYLPFKMHPAMTLYEFRLAGWIVHIFSFAVLSACLFRLSRAPLQCLLIATIPFFVCNIFGLTSPSYNTLSSDFLLISLSLLGLIRLSSTGGNGGLGLAAGLALFLATFAHPALGLVAAVILIHEVMAHDLWRNLLRRELTPSNLALLTFLACWGAFFLHFMASGAFTPWCQRMALVRISADTVHDHLAPVFLQLLIYPLSYGPMAVVLILAAGAVILARRIFRAPNQIAISGRASTFMAFASVVDLIYTFSFEPYYLPISFALIGLILVALQGVKSVASPRLEPGILFLSVMSAFAAGLYTVSTYYFHPYRSWQSGILGLPFAFAVGLALLLKARPLRSGAFRLLLITALILAVVCVGRDHYREIQRDSAPSELQVAFRLPKLHKIKSTPERVTAVEKLYKYIQPRMTWGKPLLVYDDCPMLYYLFDAKPAYGMAWAAKRGATPATLQQLNRELLAHPLPDYAIRTMVDVAKPVWRTALSINYDDYPLNETVMANYTLEQVIFPFEVWHLRPAGSGR